MRIDTKKIFFYNESGDIVESFEVRKESQIDSAKVLIATTFSNNLSNNLCCESASVKTDGRNASVYILDECPTNTEGEAWRMVESDGSLRSPVPNTAKQLAKTMLNAMYGKQALEKKENKIMNTTKNPVPGATIKRVHFSGPYTIVIWNNGEKTMVKQDVEKDTVFDPEKGLAMAIAKHFLGTNSSKGNYYDVFNKWLPDGKKKNNK